MKNRIIFQDGDELIRNIESTTSNVENFLVDGKIAYNANFQRVIGEYQGGGGGGGVLYHEYFDPVSLGIRVEIEVINDYANSVIRALTYSNNAQFYLFNDTLINIIDTIYNFSFKVASDTLVTNTYIKTGVYDLEEQRMAYVQFSNKYGIINRKQVTCYTEGENPTTTYNWVNNDWKVIIIDDPSSIPAAAQTWLAANTTPFTPYVNKVVYNNKVLIDLTEDTLINPDGLTADITAHNRAGAPIVGTAAWTWIE